MHPRVIVLNQNHTHGECLWKLILHKQTVLLVGEPLEDVENFKYLGSMFVANGQGTEEIRSRINLARSAFFRLQFCLRSRREISLRTKGRVYQAVVRSILLYGCETWPVRVADERVLEVFH